MDSREAFEKLHEINAILHNSEFGFNEDINQYYHHNHTEHRLNYAFLMGAWSVWQSRQAEVDQLNEAIERQGKLAIQAMNEAHKGSRLELSIAKDIQASLKPELIESERQMNAQLTDENMKLEARIEEKDKRIEELEKLIEVGRYARQRFINKFIGIQNHIDVNAFKAMESDPECFVIGVEDLTEFIKEVLRGEHE